MNKKEYFNLYIKNNKKVFENNKIENKYYNNKTKNRFNNKTKNRKFIFKHLKYNEMFFKYKNDKNIIISIRKFNY